MNNKETCDILLHNGSVLNHEMKIVTSTSIAISGNRIVGIMPAQSALEIYEATEIVDGTHLLFMPGLIDGHMHTGQQLLRGKILDELPMIWTRIMLPFESTLNASKMKLSSELAALEMIKSGTTGFIDAGSYFMEEAANTYLESGLRGALTHSTMDKGNLPASIAQTAKEAISTTDSLYLDYHGQGNLSIYYSLRSLISCSRELIESVCLRAHEQHTYVQAHMNEYPNEVNFHLEQFQMRPFEYLESLGVLNLLDAPDCGFVAAHGIFLSEAEMDLIASHQIGIVHCPFSNSGKGVPNTPALHSRHIPVGLGSDGTAHGGMSLWNEMKIFRSLMNATKGCASSNPIIMPAEQILTMATKGGAYLLGQKESLGSIAVGNKADLISINLDQPHLCPTNNLVHTLVESVNAGDVSDMMVNGAWIMRHRKVLTLDEERILDDARRYFETDTN